jgi:hypothetical protein
VGSQADLATVSGTKTSGLSIHIKGNDALHVIKCKSLRSSVKNAISIASQKHSSINFERLKIIIHF